VMTGGVSGRGAERPRSTMNCLTAASCELMRRSRESTMACRTPSWR
jgi:hypothetical protein